MPPADAASAADQDGHLRRLAQFSTDRAVDGVFWILSDGHILYANEAAGRILGYEPGELVGRTVPDIAPHLPQSEWERHWHDVTSRGSFTVESDLLAKDGRLIRTEVTVNFIAHEGREYNCAILRDVTEQKDVQERLRQGESRFRSLLQNASDITTVLGPDGTMRYHSPAFFRLLGWREDDVLGKCAFDFVHDDDRAQVMQVFATTLGTGAVSPAVQFRFRRADGSFVVLEGIGNDRTADPLIGGMVVNSRDVTDRLRLADELRQAQKMEAVGRLAGGIAHDFNNLLTVIDGYSEAALLDGDQESIRRSLEEIRRASERASQLTTRLLAFARRRVIMPTSVDLNTTLVGLAGMLERLIGSDVRLETRLGPDVGRIKVDRGQLEQVVMNLAINARDAMPDGGALTLETAAKADGTGITLRVIDSGHGMDHETVSHVFEPFFTTKGPGRGTGLGLATVYGIVTQHGGSIAVDSELGRGTAFTLTFPRDAAAEVTASAMLPAQPAQTGSETILLVEDESMVRSLVRRTLTLRGYAVFEAASGEEAMAQFGNAPDRIDLLLTDVVMPGINGRVLAERLTAQRPDLKVVFMSGYTEDTVLEARDQVHFLQKPFTPDALRTIVRRALRAGAIDAGG